MFKILDFTPFEIVVKAIRTCWQSFDKSDPEADKKLVYRIANQHKHLSTLEHCRIIAECNDKDLLSKINKNNYFAFIDGFMVYNLRALIEDVNLSSSEKLDMCPDPYKFLFEGDI